MNTLDWILIGLALVLAGSALIAPAGGVGIDGRHLLAAMLVVAAMYRKNVTA